jgi:hypothetical protein
MPDHITAMTTMVISSTTRQSRDFARPDAVCYIARMEGPPTDPVLTRFRTAMTELYGARIDRVVLFDSRARRCAARFRL